MSIYFLSFFTNGDDGTYDLTEVSSLIKERLSPYFNGVFLYNRDQLKDLPNSDDFCNSYDEELDMNPNANKIGYFDFKPFLIKYTLSKLPENSILIYHDGNFLKNSQYWESDWDNIHSICERLLTENNSDIFCQFEREGLYVKEMVKTYTIDKLIEGEIENDIIKDSLLINAARLILRNTKFTRDFINEYYELCLDKSLISKSPNPSPHVDFKWSCGDQDVLNCLIYKYILDGKLPSTFPIYSFLYRVIRFENKPFNWVGQSWNPHPTGSSKLSNGRLISYIENK
jgi:hypothetical protein